MKSAMEKALDRIGSLNVQKLEEPKAEKSKKGDCCCPIPYDPRPTLYLDDKELSTIGNFKAEDKVILVIECSVKSIHSSERMEGKEVKKSLNCELCVEAIADITKG
jgi:hypothetical protein